MELGFCASLFGWFGFVVLAESGLVVLVEFGLGVLAEFGLVFGGGAEFLFARNIGAFMDLRYMLGLTNLYSAPEGALQQLNPNATTPSYKFLGLQLQLGTKFHL